MCKYCDTTEDMQLIDGFIECGEGLAISLDAKQGNLVVEAEFDSGCLGESMETHINFCPMCGRKLAN